MAGQLTPEEEAALISTYWTGAPSPAAAAPQPVDAGEVDAPPAYQPNPGKPGYNPNPGAMPVPAASGAVVGTTPPVPASEQGSVAKGFSKAFSGSSAHPIFQNPFEKPPTPVDMGEIGGPPVGAPPPAPIMGPTPQDDAEFAAFRAKQDASPEEKKIAAYWGGGAPGGGAKANPDPFGLDAARQGQMKAMGDRSDALRRAADAEAVKSVQIAEGQRDLGRMQQEDAAIANAEAELTQRHFDDGMQEIGRQLDDVRAKKIDPLRMMKEQPALGVLAVIGGGLGGFYQGFTGAQHNEFLADLDRQLDRGMAEDERQINDQKFAIGQATNLLRDQRDLQKDTDLAKLQTRNLQYEAVKQQIAADAATDDIPAAKARADEMIAQVQLAQEQLAEQIAAKKQAQAAAAAGANFARAKEVQQALLTAYKEHLAQGYSPKQAMQAARSIVDTVYLGGGHVALPDAPQFGMGKSGNEEIAKENYKTAQETTGLLESIRSFDPVKVAAGGFIGAHTPNALRTDQQKTENDERERYNALVRPLVGAAWRLQTHSPEPRKTELLDEQAEAFKALPSDSPKDVARRMKNLEQHVINAAKTGGVELPDAKPSASIARGLGAKPIR